jgi:uncharacterized membrane protein
MTTVFSAVYFLFQEKTPPGLFPGPMEAGFEPTVINIVLWLKLGIEIIGAIIIVVGIVSAICELIKKFLARTAGSFTRVRLRLARHLVLALEFQLAADIISTAVAPSWEQIGKLAAIAVIRTALNYFLSVEMRSEARDIRAENGLQPDEPSESES